MHTLTELLEKYDQPVPRYTSYPTVPLWDEPTFSKELWRQSIQQAISKDPRLSLYVHLPYCEKVCTYCGCNKRITQNHELEKPYIDSVLLEWAIYQRLFGLVPQVVEIHLGGGTPTFFSAENLTRLIDGILEHAAESQEKDYSFEAHPNSTTLAHLKALHDMGFKRLSLGIQDFDPHVQITINRIQTFEQTKKIFEWARQVGYESINADLIYGLPKQNLDSVVGTIEKIKELRPDRIAFYSYAHVPWKSPTQRGYQDSDLPSAQIKRELYEAGRKLLLESGYVELGLDHFALPDEALAQAAKNQTIHRNFMGYTTQKTNLLIGLGVSSISDTSTAFAQNLKEIEPYQKMVESGELSVFKGHVLSKEDLGVRQEILSLMCRGEVRLNPERIEAIRPRLQMLLDDEIVEIVEDTLIVRERGRPFLRNAALCLDERYHANLTEKVMFSKAI